MTRRSAGKNNSAAEPHLGIFWYFNRALLINAIPLSAAEVYGHCKNHPTSHICYWAELQRQAKVPHEMEYEEAPRGRVTYDEKAEQFALFADRCVLDRPQLLREILANLHLPSSTQCVADSHYRCTECLNRNHRK